MNNRNADQPTKVSGTDSAKNSEPAEIHPAIIKWALGIGLVVAIAVTASSFKLSFSTLYDLATMARLGDSAWVIPVVLDGPILVAGIFRVALSQHTDRATVIGRRFIIAVYTLAGLASMAGNAYHAVLTVTDLNAGVAAALGALAPLMVMTMCEMMSIGISAPRHHRAKPTNAAVSDSAPFDTASVDSADEQLATTTGTPSDAEQLEAYIDEEGNLAQVVWDTADVYLNHPTAMGKFNKTADVLGVYPNTVRARYDKWVEFQQKFAAAKAAPRAMSASENEALAESSNDLSPFNEKSDGAAPVAYAGATQ
ncbi:hypothetical protein CH260_24025 [Rhodococcus sp. 05-2256-B2]|uniref:DUF2637 domain-containing protein n=1 Tax=unclassified Rhodococcus (in: high G+C Gram-positive bacteria) TaxID=192944 RepID=UPI000B9C17ED|nr:MULTISPECIES: DUF2637 domain-containing protein [unclassified Rhodococcus (in: high G+C Gram-positive bacteria)]OZD86513.1 hypothetical protein CH257_26200 [Rhodococcus sp. 05-2256-B3]OZD90757.1 hypothetical protein CH260_24025 [Rhodococcus sp. 05-2256-B2]OZD94470.1 hypothetical protein CH258_00245 [Rhodococcus sp. 05-2256-B4]OZE07174.1 hypothetical protein CH285_04905 [Rhodococcus sp. 05-2256-B1]